MALTPNQRWKIIKRDDYTCQYCGWRPRDKSELYIPWGYDSRRIALDVDHMWPRSKGGTDWEYNLVTACYWCNMKKGNKVWPVPTAACMCCGEKFTHELMRKGELLFDEGGAFFKCRQCIDLERDMERKEFHAAYELDEFSHIALEQAYYDDLIAEGWDVAA